MPIKTPNLLLLILFLCTTSIFSEAQERSLENRNGPPLIKIKYKTNDGCSFSYSPVNFCDTEHTQEIANAIKEKTPNFNKHYILITIPERPEYHQKSIVAIDSLSGVVYPVPVDAFSGTPSDRAPEGKEGKLIFSTDSKKLCIEGDILAYRVISSGNFCFLLEEEKFVGHHTPYME